MHFCSQFRFVESAPFPRQAPLCLFARSRKPARECNIDDERRTSTRTSTKKRGFTYLQHAIPHKHVIVCFCESAHRALPVLQEKPSVTQCITSTTAFKEERASAARLRNICIVCSPMRELAWRLKVSAFAFIGTQWDRIGRHSESNSHRTPFYAR